MLAAVRQTLRDDGPMSVGELARRVDADVDAVRGMLDVWSRKGRVWRATPACGGCTECDVADAEIYRWLEPDGRARA